MSTTVLEKQHVAPSKSEKESISATDVDVFSPEEETYFKNQFYGVQKVILMKRLGEKWDKFLVVVGIIAIAWAKNWEGNVIYSTSVAVTSAFQSLNLYSLINVVLYIVETVLLPMYAKFSDMIGRTEAFVLSIFFYVLSGIIQAVSPNMDTLIGGQVVYALGLSGVSVLGHVLIADITSAANRGMFQAFYDFPAMVNIWVAPIVGQAFVDSNQWRWAYSMIPFCITATAVPLLWGLYRIERTIKKSNLMPDRRQSKSRESSRIERVKYVFREFDIIGSLLFIGALCMILLPLVLGPYNWGGWNTPRTIGCLVGGFVCGLVFIAYEWKFAHHPVIPMGNWESTTPIAGVMVCACISMIRAVNWTYFMTYLQITRYASVLESTYIQRSYDAMFLLSQLLAGFLMKRFKVYRPIVFAGICLYILGMGLMIPARYPTSPLGFVVIAQVISGLGSGLIYVPCLVACQSSVPQADLAIVTALQQVGGTISTSIGSAISGALWNGLLPGQLTKHVPGEFDMARILGDITYISALPKDQHDGASVAYGNVERIMCIVSLCLAVIAFGFFLRMKPFGLSETETHKANNSSVPVEEKQEIEEKEKTEETAKN